MSKEILPYFDPITARQLKDYAIAVFNKKERFSLSKVFSSELKFVIDLLKKTISLSKSSKMKIQLIGPKQTVSFVTFVCQQICRIFQMKSWKPF